MDGHETEVGRPGGNERREQGPPGQVLEVGHLQREDHPGERRLEHRRDTSGRAGDHQHLGVVLAETVGEAVFCERADGPADQDRRPFVTEGAATAEGRAAGEEAGRQPPEQQLAVAFVIRPDIGVGGGGVLPTQPVDRGRGNDQTDERGERHDPQRLFDQSLEQLRGDDLFEQRDGQPGGDPQACCQYQHEVQPLGGFVLRQPGDDLARVRFDGSHQAPRDSLPSGDRGWRRSGWQRCVMTF